MQQAPPITTHSHNSTRARIPNALTTLRVLLAAIFLTLLSFYHHPATNNWTLPAATALFIIAALTDALDGFLARKWGVVSLFGRVMDPFADKILILGAFLMLAGPSFVSHAGHSVTSVAPWMVAIILARELLVTSLRGAYESRGVSFAAGWAGKAKMTLQSFAVPAILLLVWLAPQESLRAGAFFWIIRAIVWTTVAVTAVSAWPYLAKAIAARPAEPQREQVQ